MLSEMEGLIHKKRFKCKKMGAKKLVVTVAIYALFLA